MYNSLFLNLPFQKVTNIGMLIPLLYHGCRNGLESGRTPVEILESFFKAQTTMETGKEKIDFMFRVIQNLFKKPRNIDPKKSQRSLVHQNVIRIHIGRNTGPVFRFRKF
jgi:hypothetical protein